MYTIIQTSSISICSSGTPRAREFEVQYRDQLIFPLRQDALVIITAVI